MKYQSILVTSAGLLVVIEEQNTAEQMESEFVPLLCSSSSIKFQTLNLVSFYGILLIFK